MSFKVQFVPLGKFLMETENPKDILAILKVISVLILLSKGQTSSNFYFKDYLNSYKTITNLKRVRTTDKEKACLEFQYVFERRNNRFVLSNLARKVCYFTEIRVNIIYEDSNSIFSKLSKFELEFFEEMKTSYINIDVFFFKNCHNFVRKIYDLEPPWIIKPPRITEMVDNVLILVLFFKVSAMLFYKGELSYKRQFTFKKDEIINLLHLAPSLIKEVKEISSLLDSINRVLCLSGIGFLLDKKSDVTFYLNANVFNTKTLALWGNHLVIKGSEQLVKTLYADRLETQLNFNSYQIIPLSMALLDEDILDWKNLNQEFGVMSPAAKKAFFLACNSFEKILELLSKNNVFQLTTTRQRKCMVQNVKNYDQFLSEAFQDLNRTLASSSQYQKKLVKANLNAIRSLALIGNNNKNKYKYLSKAKRNKIFPTGYLRDKSNYTIMPNRHYEKLDKDNNLPLIILPKDYKNLYYNLSYWSLQISAFIYNIDVKSCHATIALFLVKTYRPSQYKKLLENENVKDIYTLFNYRNLYEKEFPSELKNWISLKQMKGLFNSLLYGRKKGTIYMRDLISPTSMPKEISKSTLEFINNSFPGKVIQLWLDIISNTDDDNLTMLSFDLPKTGELKIKNGVIQKDHIKISHRSQSAIQALEFLIINAVCLDITGDLNGTLLSLEHDGLIFSLKEKYTHEEFANQVKFTRFNELCVKLQFDFKFEFEIW